MAVTIKDIAKKAGVSHSTVSRALRSSPLISDETTELIRKIAVELGYSPSAAARSLKTNRSRALGVVVSRIDDPFYGEILEGIEEIAQERGYSTIIAASRQDPDRVENILRVLQERRVDGVLICSALSTPKQQQELSDFGIPIVVINDQSAEDFQYSVFHDDIDGSRILTRHLIELGHQRIAYLGNSQAGRTTQDRKTGYQREMSAAGLEIPAGYIHQVTGGNPHHGLQAVIHFLALPAPPTALFCFNDLLAVGALKGLNQAGLRVPDDISVAGFDNIELSLYTTPALTTVDQPKRHIGSQATRLLIDLLDPDQGETSPDKAIQSIKGRLIVRESTASPP